MKRILKEIVQTVVLIAALNFPAAAEVSKKSSVFLLNEHVVSIDGELNDETVREVKQLWKETRFKILTITSPGGDFDAGLDLGLFVAAKKLTVYVPKQCNSSCSLVFFSASTERRDMSDTAVMGLHNISLVSTNGADPDTTFVSVRQLMEFTHQVSTKVGYLFTLYAHNGIPAETLIDISTKHGEDIVVLRRTDLVKWGIIQ